MPPYSCAVPGSRGRVTGYPQNPQEVGLCSQLGGLPPPQRATPHTGAPSRHPEYGDVTNPEGILQDLQIKWVPRWAKPPLLAPTSVNDSPGRKPGTSTNVMSGILNASQNRTKRAPFTDELMSKHPRKRSSRLSFWAIPSPTHTGNVPPATMQSWLLRRHQSHLLRKRLRGSSHSRKNWEDRRTHLALARGPRSGAAPEGPAAKPRAGSQSQPCNLKGCLLPPDAQPASPLQPVMGGDIRGWS